MSQKYTKEELWKLYEKLPQELKDAIFAEETANHIRKISERYGIEEKKISETAENVGNVLLGLLPPEDFQKVLEVELKLEKETAEKVAREINRFIFYPVKPALEQLYKTEKNTEKEKTAEEIIEQQPKKNNGQDRYRELI